MENSLLSFNLPEQLTKRLAFTRLSDGRRKLVVSTNWLPLVGFEADAPNIERSLGDNKGIVVERVRDLFDLPGRVKKVYTRTYKRRKNNPIEHQLDISSQKLLDRSFPADCKHVHVTFTPDRVEIRPLTSLQQRAMDNAKKADDPLSVFAACTSGVDLRSMSDNGFSIHSVIEWRPPEARDKVDLSETGALNVLANIPGVKAIYNEDINQIDVARIADAVAKSPFTNLSISVQCDDFSTAKGTTLKERSLADLSSSIDMGYDLLRLVESLAPPTLTIENVPAWINSDMYKMISLRLRKWGYQEHCLVADARDHGGLTSRKRAYSFFTALPNPFSWEKPQTRRQDTIWGIVKEHLPGCRHVSHSKSLQDGLESGRLRTITRESCHSPTFLKSQIRMAKDSVVIADQGKLFWPTEGLMKRLMGIPKSFNLSNCSSSIASEIIGQSVDMGLHEMVVRSVKRHLLAFQSQLLGLTQLHQPTFS
ncbi:DNA cytosine methyltransferase [Marinobacterium jannaschii]|uniref:DNA cytosine methyltransferase n=1 Tax=Marinobacterium jannaschii TaxID=64970 RepID=UPI0004828578|nr:DNA cytosine methyltransferase [Marinobacterium jannaschii]